MTAQPADATAPDTGDAGATAPGVTAADAVSDGGTARSRRRLGTVRDITLSMLVVLGLVLAILALVPRASGDPVRVVDVTGPAQQARAAAPYPVYVPAGLEAGWRATSARVERAPDGTTTWHVGFVTPAYRYAALEQTDAPRVGSVERLTVGGAPQGAVRLGGASWERRVTAAQRSLVRTDGRAVVVVTGDADWPELQRLASALRA